MKEANTALVSGFVGVLGAAWVANANAQQAAPPPYQPTKNEFRAMAVSEDRIGQLEKRVGALEDYMAAGFNNAAPNSGQPVPPPGPGGNGTALPGGATPAKGGHYHQIQEGETLHSIATKFHVSLDQLVADNKLDPYGPIYVGDKLWIAGANPAPNPQPQSLQEVNGTPSSSAGWTAAYQVQAGDTLHSLARKTGVSPQDIVQHNRLSNANQIFVGQQLVLPAGRLPGQPGAGRTDQHSPPAPATSADTFHYYDVVAGDTLSSIAKTFFTSEEELKRMNQLPVGQLQPGQRIVVPTRLYFENLRRQQRSGGAPVS